MYTDALRRVVLVPDAVRVYLPSRESRCLARSTSDSLTAVSSRHKEGVQQALIGLLGSRRAKAQSQVDNNKDEA